MISHVNVLHHWKLIELKTKQGHPQCGPKGVLREIKNGAKTCVKCQIWLHKLITPMKSPFCVEVHNVSTHNIFVKLFTIAKWIEFKFVFLNCGSKNEVISKTLSLLMLN